MVTKGTQTLFFRRRVQCLTIQPAHDQTAVFDEWGQAAIWRVENETELVQDQLKLTNFSTVKIEKGKPLMPLRFIVLIIWQITV